MRLAISEVERTEERSHSTFTIVQAERELDPHDVETAREFVNANGASDYCPCQCKDLRVS